MLITGLGTRLGALAILGTMSIAIYHAISINGFNIYLLELLGLYWGGSLCLMLNGAGKFSIDYLIVRTNQVLFGNLRTMQWSSQRNN